MGDGVLCAVDSDGDNFTDIDISALYYCQPDSESRLCQQVRQRLVASLTALSMVVELKLFYRTSAHSSIIPCNHLMY